MTTAMLDRHDGQTTTEEARTATPLHVLRLSGELVVIDEQPGETAQQHLDRAGITLGGDEILSLNGQVITADEIVPAGNGATNVLTLADEIANG